MEHAFELGIPTKLEEVCNPKRLALVVYDMQVGILSQIKNAEQILFRVQQDGNMWIRLNKCNPDFYVIPRHFN